MHEYEFRLVVEHHTPFLPLLQSLGHPIRRQAVYYLKPHFRYRLGRFETKRVKSVRAVYHDGLWFRWVHSVETPFARWSRATRMDFLHNIGNYQDPFTAEFRHVVTIDDHVQLYAFRTSLRSHKLVFEWEHGTFRNPLAQLNPAHLIGSLTRYRNLYALLKDYPAPSYTLNEQLSRRPVACIDEIPEGGNYVYAHKLDGVFGLVYSYRDKIKEKWEGYECVLRQNVTLGDGLVYAAERLEDGRVYLLDVYHVRGHDVAKWCKREILTHFLPNLTLSDGYDVQTYVTDEKALNPNPPVKTDGVIVHDVVRDVVFKYKTTHSVDLVYSRGYFHLPEGRIECSEEGLEEGCVYEISTSDGRVLRKRVDRFKGNSSVQLKNIFKHGWHGPAIETVVAAPKKKKLKK